MTRRLVGVAAAAMLMSAAWGCGGDEGVQDPGPVVPAPGAPIDTPPDAGVDAGPDAGPDGGDDGGTDGGGDGGTDGGTDGGGDGGTDGGSDAGPDYGPAGPWPTDAVVNYSQRYGVSGIDSVGVDEGYNIWLLDGARIGVLKPGTTAASWVSNLGQAAGGFGTNARATGSTVICGGAAGKAYVGYATYDDFSYGHPGWEWGNYAIAPNRYDFYAPEKFPGSGAIRYDEREQFLGTFDQGIWDELLKGDVDMVTLDASGAPALQEHLHRSLGRSDSGAEVVRGWKERGIQNTNDYHFDEDRTVYSCMTVRRGPLKGEVFVGTNHGATRIKDVYYNSHRHPVWWLEKTQMTGLMYGLGTSRDGTSVLMANEWTVGIVTPGALADWDNMNATVNPMPLAAAYVSTAPAPSKESFAHWRGFEQTTDGNYYVGSLEHGLHRLIIRSKNDAQVEGEKVAGAPQSIRTMAATDDGSLFMGGEAGLYRMDAQKQVARVDGVSGGVKQLVYDPTVTPSMLYVLTTGGTLYVLRGH